MTYLVLARKYRPKSFSEVVGQRNATATLRGAIEEERIGHAYLFCGPRGTGKTTTARIFAKALNCEKGPTAEPCGTCERCRAAEDGSEADIVEIDAASNRGIDDIRQLRESASYRPMRARFKIFIVDEAHMLTKEAVNAFLKTLEEPPPHVKLFFATTEPEKLLPTFVSRCQLVRLELLPEAEIAARLAAVFEKEGIRAGAGVAEEIARRSRGGLRDALSLADQLVSLVGNEPAPADLEKLSEGTGREEIEALLDRVEAGDRAGALAALPPVEGGERELLAGLLATLRNSLLAGLCGPEQPLLDLDAASKQRARERFDRLGCERIENFLAELLRARERIELLKSVSARWILEAALLDLCRPETSLPLEELQERLLALEVRLSGGAAPRAAVPAPATAAPAAAPARPRPPPPPAAAPAAPPARSEEWPRLLEVLEAEARTIGEILRARGKLESRGPGAATIRLTGLRDEERAIVAEPRNARIVSAALSRIVGSPCEASLVVADAGAPKRTASDLFTRQVAESFGGKIVEEA
ncbi:MAG TPA: DNA polymerase III subunit gamma/tau [Myxococcota bacterium]|nr:DNA polymerase III subunit gamma/tau [Myxococcota bacterium]